MQAHGAPGGRPRPLLGGWIASTFQSPRRVFCWRVCVRVGKLHETKPLMCLMKEWRCCYLPSLMGEVR